MLWKHACTVCMVREFALLHEHTFESFQNPCITYVVMGRLILSTRDLCIKFKYTCHQILENGSKLHIFISVLQLLPHEQHYIFYNIA